jgi:hypothetical protein
MFSVHGEGQFLRQPEKLQQGSTPYKKKEKEQINNYLY